MTLGERMKTILMECNIKQVEFADAMGVGSNYVSQLVNGKKTSISGTLAKLIEETYGYSAHWLMTGEGEKRALDFVSSAKLAFMKKIKTMPDDEIVALLAFANSLDSVKQALGIHTSK